MHVIVVCHVINAPVSSCSLIIFSNFSKISFEVIALSKAWRVQSKQCQHWTFSDGHLSITVNSHQQTVFFVSSIRLCQSIYLCTANSALDLFFSQNPFDYSIYFFQAGTVTNSTIWLVRSAVQIFLQYLWPWSVSFFSFESLEKNK